jgi:hypothetical protein
LFEGRFAYGSTRFADIAPDGQRFVMLQNIAVEEGAAEPQKLIVVLNWFDEVNELVPTGN